MVLLDNDNKEEVIFIDLLAHLTNINGERKEQSLKDHCVNVAEYAWGSVENANLHHVVYLAGILHDMGKAKKEFSEYLEAAYQGKEVRRGTVNHTFAGVIWLLEKYHTTASSKWERLTSEVVGYAIGAHHGMFDCTDLEGGNGFLHRLEKDKTELCYKETVQNYFAQVVREPVLEDYFHKAAQEVEDFFVTAKNTYGAEGGGKIFFQISMLVRLVLSAVIYGDRRDTSEFMGSLSRHEEQAVGWEKRREYFEKKMAALDSFTRLNQVRNDISCQCLEAASRPVGIYRLNVPTGAGKTLCTLRMALAHAEKYHKKRIIFIIPLLSILDQNAKVIRDYIWDRKAVLEHHSNVVHEREKGEEADPYDFLGESWNYPVVVSTMVQFLNILFSYETSAIGRMQALCDSILVIDEVQSLPKKATVMFNMAMNFLQQYCGATIVLSSATQPCFEELKWPLHLAKNPDMVKLNEKQLSVFRRSEIIDRTDSSGMDMEEFASFCMDQMEEFVSVLVICNTKNEAGNLFEKIQEQAKDQNWNIFHLSTAMCQEHRQQVLEEIKRRLAEIQEAFRRKAPIRKLICISTQLIEAGVDLSFQCVIRVLAGIDNLAQAAGRCNRSKEYGQEGKLFLIYLKDENLRMLKEIKNAQDSTLKVIKTQKNKEESLIGEQATRNYYQYLFGETESIIRHPILDNKRTIYLADLLSNYNGNAENAENKKFILHQPFQTAGRTFTVFDQMTTDIVTPYGQGKILIERLEALQKERFDLKKYNEILRRIKKYTVSIYKWQKQKLELEGMLYSILDGRVWVLDERAYNSRLGLIVGDQPVENYIF